MVLTGMYHSWSLSSFYTCTVKNEQRQISISNHHSRVPKWRTFDSACFDACLECQVTVLSKLDFKRMCMQKVLIFEKKVLTSWIRTCDLLTLAALPIEECCLSFFHFIALNPLQKASWPPHYLIAMTNLKEKDNRFVMLGSWYSDVSSPRRVNSVTDSVTGFQLYID